MFIVIAVEHTGFGTQGQKWRALLYGGGELIEVPDAWRYAGHFYVVSPHLYTSKSS